MVQDTPCFGPDVTLDDPAFIHPTALIYGKVYVGPGVSMWPYSVIRAELHEVRVGARSNIQDHCMLHAGYENPVIMGEDCSITHHATLHGCTLGDRVLIGIGATIMDGAVIGDNSIVAGNAIVREGAAFPANAVIAGVPAKQVAEADNSRPNVQNARFYLQNAANYADGRHWMTDEELARAMSVAQSPGT